MRRKKLESTKLLSSMKTRKPQQSEAQVLQERDENLRYLIVNAKELSCGSQVHNTCKPLSREDTRKRGRPKIA